MSLQFTASIGATLHHYIKLKDPVHKENAANSAHAKLHLAAEKFATNKDQQISFPKVHLRYGNYVCISHTTLSKSPLLYRTPLIFWRTTLTLRPQFS